MAVLPGPLPDGRRSGGDEGLGSRLAVYCALLSNVITTASGLISLAN